MEAKITAKGQCPTCGQSVDITENGSWGHYCNYRIAGSYKDPITYLQNITAVKDRYDDPFAFGKVLLIEEDIF